MTLKTSLMHIWGRLEGASAKIVCFKKCYENKKKIEILVQIVNYKASSIIFRKYNEWKWVEEYIVVKIKKSLSK